MFAFPDACTGDKGNIVGTVSGNGFIGKMLTENSETRFNMIGDSVYMKGTFTGDIRFGSCKGRPYKGEITLTRVKSC
jgi:hypothetical protein